MQGRSDFREASFCGSVFSGGLCRNLLLEHTHLLVLMVHSACRLCHQEHRAPQQGERTRGAERRSDSAFEWHAVHMKGEEGEKCSYLL